jgi:predicted RNA-binding Zn-ribbon protein involved in translation (DUF1610 family)
MTPATMKIVSRFFFACPHCGNDEAHEVTHFEEDRSFGPWQCNVCGWEVTGLWHAATKSVDIATVRERPRSIQGYLLVRLKSSDPVYFIVEDTLYNTQEVRDKEYWVNEYTCPTNIVPVEEIITGHGDGYDEDPHGVLEFIDWKPKNYNDDSDPDWQMIFPQLAGETIDGNTMLKRISARKNHDEDKIGD